MHISRLEGDRFYYGRVTVCVFIQCFMLRFLLLLFLWFFDVMLGVSPFGSVPVLYCSSVVCLYLGGFR